jgi:hypothetical protein
MNRYDTAVGMICCRTDLATINALAMAGGLSAQQGDKPHLFCLSNSGRSVEPEVGEELFDAFRHALDHAAHTGAIPAWSVIRDRDHSR